MSDDYRIEYRAFHGPGAGGKLIDVQGRHEAHNYYLNGNAVQMRALKNGEPVDPPTWFAWSPKESER